MNKLLTVNCSQFFFYFIRFKNDPTLNTWWSICIRHYSYRNRHFLHQISTFTIRTDILNVNLSIQHFRFDLQSVGWDLTSKIIWIRLYKERAYRYALYTLHIQWDCKCMKSNKNTYQNRIHSFANYDEIRQIIAIYRLKYWTINILVYVCICALSPGIPFINEAKCSQMFSTHVLYQWAMQTCMKRVNLFIGIQYLCFSPPSIYK